MATWLVVKSTLLLALPALIVPLAGRRVSAASRHMTWGAGLAAALLLPVASLIVPAWPVTIRVAARTPVVLSAPGASIDADTAPDSLAPQSATNQWQSATASAAATERSRPFDWTSWVAPVYGLGLLAMMLHLAAQHWVVRRIAGRARAMDDPRWSWLLHDCARAMAVDQRVRLLRSPELGTPVAIGLLRPSIVLPAVADTWPDDRRRAVLLHELAHVSRRDCLTQTLACLARAIHWFNPLAWWAARQLRAERELACDDRVLAAGTAPREYAGHLLEIAYGLGDRQTPALAVGMARPGQLEGRMLAALDDARPRSRPTLRFRLASISLTAVLVGPMSGATPLFVEDPGARLTDDEPVPASVDPKPLAKTLRAAPWKQHVDHLLGAFGATGAAAAERGQGTWEVRPGHKLGTLHLRIAEDHSSTERDVPIAQVEGLTAGQLNGADGPVQFRIRRDAGTFTFTGVVKNGVGAGTFAFEADARFAQELASRGIGKPTADQQYRLARADVGYALLDALKAQGYSTPSLEDLATAGEHGVSADYVQEMGRLGYKLGTLEPLITLRDHGVTPEYVSGLAALGYKGLSADAVRTARDHGVTPDYVRALQEAGYTQVPMDTLVTVRDHGITPDYIRDLVTAGYRGTPLDTLVQVRDHGVTGDYIRGMQGLGFGLSLEQLVNARDHGVTVEYATAIKGFGYTNETIETLIQMRDHGVTESYVKSVKELGYDRLSPGELIRLRDHGLTPDRIKRANGAGAARLSVDELVDKADRGL
jgi:beta-lactamase regulating signal transducer with metallopeptidase domain